MSQAGVLILEFSAYLYNKSFPMKLIRYTLTLCLSIVLLSSCSLFQKSGSGCPSNGKNVGAEKLLDGSDVPKAKKFKS